MEITPNPGPEQYQRADFKQQEENLNKLSEENSGNDEKLKEVVSEFTSIFLNQMFKAMRDTVPEEGLIDGGFAEDVFTDMHDQEISKMGSKQNSFNNLNQVLYQQLSGSQSGQ
ncbi:MAG: rod-binding protein [Bacillota bacterium]